MTLFDSSVLIDYLDGAEAAVAYVEARSSERAIVPPLVLFEVYQGEVYRSEPADFDAVDRALAWLTVVETTAECARIAAELQDRLHRHGEPLSARDAFVAGTAIHRDEPLAASDADFDSPGLRDQLTVELLRT